MANGYLDGGNIYKPLKNNDERVLSWVCKLHWIISSSTSSEEDIIDTGVQLVWGEWKCERIILSPFFFLSQSELIFRGPRENSYIFIQNNL